MHFLLRIGEKLVDFLVEESIFLGRANQTRNVRIMNESVCCLPFPAKNLANLLSVFPHFHSGKSYGILKLQK